MSAVQLWCVHDAGDEMAHLVLARDGDEAIRLFVATTGYEDVAQLRAEHPTWRLTPSKEPAFPARVLGIWAPDDATMAGYGFIPGEDYLECECCGLVLDEEDFPEDSDVCCGCAP